MNTRKGLPWFALVISSAGAAAAQSQVRDDAAANRQFTGSAMQSAARERRSISLSGEGAAFNGIVPEFHGVDRGDTLWDITGYYFNNPWNWPRVWGLNPQITNPHWIFPGDQVRLRTPGITARPTASTNLVIPPQRLTPGTVQLRDEGWLDRQEGDQAGTIVGAPEDNMLLSEGDQAYVEFRNRTPRVGETFTIYQDAHATRGGDRSVGRVVRIIGTAVVETWDRDRNLATVRITESTDAIERGEYLARIPRRLQTVPPVQNSANLQGTVVATTHPRELVGQNMVVFINRGSDDRVAVGNRFFVMRRGDGWRRSLRGISPDAASGSGLDRDGDGNADRTPGTQRADSRMPEEVVGEAIVLEVRARSCTALVTSAIAELEVGDGVEMRRGY